jgi:YVTN family beta-propeller protein
VKDLPSSPVTKPTSTSTSAGKPSGPVNVYQFTQFGLDPRMKLFPTRVYVPNSDEGSVSVIDPSTYKVIDKFKVGKNPQHIGPSWDFSKLYVSNDLGNSLTPINPTTGKPEPQIPVTDPYNLYYTPDGTSAIVVAERLRRLDFRDPHTWQLQFSIPIARKGANHLDFSADGKTFLISCEFSGWVEKVDLATKKVVGEVDLKGTPIDVKLSPDGTVFYVANMDRGGVSIVNPTTMTEEAFLPTGMGAHGLYPSRNGKFLYVSNRHANSVSVIDFALKKVVATWPFTGTPDMGGVSADGNELWLSGRYSSEVYVIDTRTGVLAHRIPVAKGPHGLSFFPQPGRYSLGHTGNYR